MTSPVALRPLRARSPRAVYLAEGPAAVGVRGTLAALVGGAAAAALLDRFHDLPALACASPAALAATAGVSRGQAATVHAAFALARHAVEQPPRTGRVLTASDAACWLVARLSALPHEELHGLFLDRRQGVIAAVQLSSGGVDHTLLDPRSILGEALRVRASSIIVGHNHPWGEPEPSPEDRVATRRLADAARVVGVHLADHLVISGARWVSMALRGEISA